MDYNNNNTNYNYNGYPNQNYIPKPIKPTNKFAIASLILGICSILFFCTLIGPVALGALGILFAILSKRKDHKMESSAMAGIITSAFGAITAVVVWVGLFAVGFTMLKPENRDVLDSQFEEIYGMDLEEYIQLFYGDEFTEEQLDDALDVFYDMFD